MYTTRILALLVCLCVHTNALEDLEKSWPIFGNGPFAYDRQLDKDQDTFAFTSCNYTTPDEQHLACEFVLVDLIEEESNKLTCSLNLTASDNRRIKRELQIERLGKKSVFFAWSELTGGNRISVTNYNVLRLTDCKLVFAKNMPSRTFELGKSLTFVTYNSALDIIDYTNETCGAVCRINYDDDKDVVTYTAMPSNLTALFLIPVDIRTPTGEFFTLDGFPYFAVNYLGTTGHPSEIITLPTRIMNYWITPRIQGHLGVCYRYRNTLKIECTRVNTKGEEVKSKELILDQGTSISGIQNLHDGGFLLMTGRCEGKLFSTASCTDKKAMKITKDGDVRESFDAPSPTADCNREFAGDSLRIVEQDVGYCFYYASVCTKWINQREVKTIKYDRKCIN